MSIWEELKMQYRLGGMAQKIIYWNVALFAIPFALKGILYLFQISFPFDTWFALSSNPLGLIWRPWSLLTYGFFHAGFFHLLFNRSFIHLFIYSSILIFYFLVPRRLTPSETMVAGIKNARP